MASPVVQGLPALLHGPDPPVASWTANLPTNRVVGEFVVIHLLIRDPAVAPSTPGGWLHFGTSPAGSTTQYFYYRRLDGSETDTVSAALSVAEYVSATSFRVSGVNHLDPLSGTPTGNTPPSGTGTSTWLNFATDVVDTLVLNGGGNGGPFSVSGWDNGATELYDAAVLGTGIARNIYGAYKAQALTGNTGETHATSSSTSPIWTNLHYALGPDITPPAAPTGLTLTTSVE